MTVVGILVNCPGNIETLKFDLTTIKCHWRSAIPALDTDIMFIDVKYFYLDILM